MTNTKNWEKEFDKFWELQFPNSHPAEYGVVKKFISSLLSRRDAEVVEIVESKRSLRSLPEEFAPLEVVVGKIWEIARKKHNRDIDDILAALKTEEKCDEAWDTEYPCDLPKGHEGEHKNSFARG